MTTGLGVTGTDFFSRACGNRAKRAHQNQQNVFLCLSCCVYNQMEYFPGFGGSPNLVQRCNSFLMFLAILFRLSNNVEFVLST